MRYLMMMFLLLCGWVAADVDFNGIPIVALNPLSAQAVNTSQSLNESTDYVGAVFVARKTEHIDRVNFYFASHSGTADNIAITAYIDHVAATGYPDGGHHATKEVIGGWSDGTWCTITFDTPYEVTAGVTYAAYIKNTTTTPNSPSTDKPTIIFSHVIKNMHLFPTTIYSSTGAADARTANSLPCVWPQYSDGEMPKGFWQGIGTVLTVASDTTPDEVATCFTVANPWIIKGALLFLTMPDGGDFSVNLYEDADSTTHSDTPVTTVTLDEDVLNANSYGWINVEFPDYSCHAGHTYRISVLPTTTTAAWTIMDFTYPSLAAMNAFTGYPIYEAVRTNGGDNNWTAYNTGTFKFVPIIPLMGNMTISAGGYFGDPFGGGF